MNRYQVLPVDERYNDTMIDIVRNSPIHAGGMTLYFDKSPDLFRTSELAYSGCRHLGFFADNELKGFASLGYREAIINGLLQTIFTFYNFYILPEARGMHFPEKAARIFLQEASEKAKYGYYITMKGNRNVESFVIRQNHPWSPPYGIADELVVKSIIFSFPFKNTTKYKVRNATANDIPEIVRLLNGEQGQRDFGKRTSEEEFEHSLEKRSLSPANYYVAENSKGNIKGVCLAWDCSSFRRTIVERFSYKFYPLLYTYRLLAHIIPMAPFPLAGERFNELTITDYAAEDRDINVMHALLAEIYYRNLNRKYHFMNFASCRNDDLLKAAKGFLHLDIISNIIVFNNNSEQPDYTIRLPYIDIAGL
ncbi:MAG TPA: hypothetical protein VK179_16245 [Bacteroidales bacterium]|nr:hypothetical protein [Bacteroidales bacterium]